MSADTEKKKHGLKHVVQALGRPKVASMLALGFASGLPFLLTGATFGYWLRDEGTTLTAIGFLSWVGLAYTFKVFWAPLMDRLRAPLFGVLGWRRGWALFAQVLVAAGLIGMAAFGAHGPGGLATIGAFALIVAFASATQDIAVDAWRIEAASDADELGLITSAFQLGYRLALLVTDALILVFAQHLGWPVSYVLMAVFMGVGVFASLRTPEPARTVIEDNAEAQAVGKKAVPDWRIYASVTLFLIASAWAFLASLVWLAPGADIARAGPIGIFLSVALLACAAFAVFRFTKPAWMAGAAIVAVMTACALYSAFTESRILGGANFLWPMVACGVGAAFIGPERAYRGVVGPLLEFFRVHGPFAAVMLLMISLYRLPEFLIGPVAGPFYSDLGLGKDIVGGVRASVGLLASLAGIAVGGLAVLRMSLMRAMILGAIMQGVGVAAYAVVALTGPDLRIFALAMATDNFCYAFAGVTLVTYMSSLTSIGYTATQYALLSSTYTLFGKFLKGFSGAVVDGVAVHTTLMNAYATFYVGAGLVAAPALILCLMIAAHQRTRAAPA